MSQRPVHIKPRLESGNMSPAIIFGHADADGHLAAEQTRTNLRAAGVNIESIVIGSETKNYRFWERCFSSTSFTRFRLVVVVDIAFSFRNPDQSLDAVLRTTDKNPGTEFIVIDHHPLTLPLRRRGNLTLVEVDSPYECCLGPPSDDLMVLAALCDGAKATICADAPLILKERAIGMRRAAADFDGLVGSNLLALLENRRWDLFEALAREPSELHSSVRGRRRVEGPASPLLEAIKADLISWCST